MCDFVLSTKPLQLTSIYKYGRLLTNARRFLSLADEHKLTIRVMVYARTEVALIQ